MGTSERGPENSPLSRRRALRRQATRPEQLMWSALRNRRLGGLKFRRQHSIGPYIVDFVCEERKLIVEIDGGYHDHVGGADKARQRELELAGYTVVRFANDDVLKELEAVVRALGQLLKVRVD